MRTTLALLAVAFLAGGGALAAPAAAGEGVPLRFAQQRSIDTPTRPTQPPNRGGGGRTIGIGIGIVAPVVIDALTGRPQARPQDEPAPRAPSGAARPSGGHRPPPPGRVVLPDPAPLPPVFPAPAAVAAEPEFWPGEVIVVLPADAGPGAAAALAQDFGLAVERETALQLTGQRIVVFAIPDPRPVGEVAAALLADPRAAAVQPNLVYRSGSGIVRGSMAPGQYALRVLGVADAHARAQGRGVTIAVIDSQVATGHPELDGAIAGSHDAAGRGIAAADPHGTSIAGILAARGGLVGVAPEAHLLAVRAFWKEAADGPAMSSSEAIARGIDWAAAHGARVLNLSFVGPRDRLTAGLLAAARERGVIAVAAAGNNGPGAPPAYPAAYDGVIAVTATDARNGLYAAANRGAYVEIAAPGVDILAPAPGGGYQTISGTSMAAAHISGVIALLIEASGGGALSPDAARAALAGTARDLGPPGRDPDFGAGLADAAALLAAQVSASAARDE